MVDTEEELEVEDMAVGAVERLTREEEEVEEEEEEVEEEEEEEDLVRVDDELPAVKDLLREVEADAAGAAGEDLLRVEVDAMEDFDDDDGETTMWLTSADARAVEEVDLDFVSPVAESIPSPSSGLAAPLTTILTKDAMASASMASSSSMVVTPSSERWGR